MIEFYGEYSETSKKFLLKQNAVLGMIVSLMVALILVTILLFLAIAFKFWMILFFLFPIIITVILTVMAPYIQKNKTLNQIVPEKIEINEMEDYLCVYFKNTIISKKLQEVKKVIEMEEWYILKLSFPKLSGFLCQKNLLKEGTIQEFEKIFEGKIIRK